ncbi:hypothetical protein [Roseomonas xinghualingensis]|uniref:hypothetical protein n=1 Tax=Roseomonas xinghualingensis TaxID=2986475 RepID=UPI0021F19C20|nr:hypothetical protein [Roseomonas sp. SXEYE001]MCV4207379.1 hypothetical protein [Roseomonas sp. SXEYE001]
MSAPPLTSARPEDLRETVFYASRFSPTGKPHGTRLRDDPEGMADAVVTYLQLATSLIFQGPPTRQHSGRIC